MPDLFCREQLAHLSVTNEMEDETPRRRSTDSIHYIDLCQRVANLEKNQTETQFLLRENASMTSRLNDTLIEMKEEFKTMRLELHDIHDLEISVTALQAGFSLVRWIGASLGGIAILLAAGYAAKVIGVAI